MDAGHRRLYASRERGRRGRARGGHGGERAHEQALGIDPDHQRVRRGGRAWGRLAPRSPAAPPRRSSAADARRSRPAHRRGVARRRVDGARVLRPPAAEHPQGRSRASARSRRSPARPPRHQPPGERSAGSRVDGPQRGHRVGRRHGRLHRPAGERAEPARRRLSHAHAVCAERGPLGRRRQDVLGADQRLRRDRRRRGGGRRGAPHHPPAVPRARGGGRLRRAPRPTPRLDRPPGFELRADGMVALGGRSERFAGPLRAPPRRRRRVYLPGRHLLRLGRRHVSRARRLRELRGGLQRHGDGYAHVLLQGCKGQGPCQTHCNNTLSSARDELRHGLRSVRCPRASAATPQRLALRGRARSRRRLRRPTASGGRPFFSVEPTRPPAWRAAPAWSAGRPRAAAAPGCAPAPRCRP